ncbi:MAG: hypothetical protein ACUVTD_05035, partial [Nitrososphaerales archaeon]
MGKYTKASISILVISMLFVSSLPLMTRMTSGFGVPPGADPPEWYMTVQGVLDTDTYTLYPYEQKSLKIGFSQFGEMIDSINNVGLEYAGERDPFAPPAGPTVDTAMPKRVWMEGWLINITYFSTITGKMRNVWATAQHADLLEYGNGWIRVDNDYPVGPASESEEDPRDPGYYIGSVPALYGLGGRKTNGTVTTDPIEVLYDGPRRFVARLVNHVSDWIQLAGTVKDVPLVDIIITIDFNKDKKEVNLLKDVKIVAPKGTYSTIPIDYWFPTEPIVGDYGAMGFSPSVPGIGDWFSDSASDGYQYSQPSDGKSWIHRKYPAGFPGLFIQFSNRGEWDLGKPPTYTSYVHFFTQGGQDPPFDYILPTTPLPQLAGPDEDVVEGLATVYDYPWALTTTIFPNYYSRHGSEPDTTWGDTFDMAQIIGFEGSGVVPKYVGWAAYWPSLSDWAVDGMSQWWKSLTTDDPHTIDRHDEPFRSPYLIGEWDFLLSDTAYTISYPWQPDQTTPEWPGAPIKVDKQFRGVTVYGVTDLHNDNAPGTGPDDEDYEYEWSQFSEVPLEVPFGPISPIEDFVTKKFFDPDAIKATLDLPPMVGRGYDDNMNGFNAWNTGPKGLSGYEENIIDQEVAYQLYEKFKPWDLEKSSEKWTMRWVEFG